MSSSFMNSSGMVNVSNARFWTVCNFALELAAEREDPPEGTLEKFKSIEEKFGPTPDVDIDELFSKEELTFWAEVFNELADKIYQRKIGDQENQEWQVWTIWMACSVARLFNASYESKNSQEGNYTEELKFRKLGELSLRNNDPEQALKNLEKALTYNPDSPVINYLTGLAHKRLNNFLKASIYLEKAEKSTAGFAEWII